MSQFKKEVLGEFMLYMYGDYNSRFRVYPNPFVRKQEVLTARFKAIKYSFLKETSWRENCDLLIHSQDLLETYDEKRIMDVYLQLHMTATFIVDFANTIVSTDDCFTKIFGDSHKAEQIMAILNLHDITLEDINRLNQAYFILERHIDGLRTPTLMERLGLKKRGANLKSHLSNLLN